MPSQWLYHESTITTIAHHQPSRRQIRPRSDAMTKYVQSRTRETQGAEWLREVTIEAERMASPNQPIHINITVDNSTHDNSYHDNRQVHMHHHAAALPQYQMNAPIGLCTPNRFHITSGFDAARRWIGHEGDAPNDERQRWINAANTY